MQGQMQGPMQNMEGVQFMPTYTPSTLTGSKKALLIGINYTNSTHPLRGCINDVHNVRQFLVTHYGFPETPDRMLILTDDQDDPT